MEFKRVFVLVGAVAIALLGNSVQEVGAIFDAPPQYDGYFYPVSNPNGKSLPILLEAFNDPMCPFSKAAWPVIKEVTQYYGSSLFLVIHEFPVPFHRNSFMSTKALHIANTLNSSLTIPLLELFYENQESLTTNATYDITPANITHTIIDLAVSLGLPRDKMVAGFNDTNFELITRASFKYICSRYITSTPSYAVNGAPMPADDSWTLDQWKQYLDPLFASIG